MATWSHCGELQSSILPLLLISHGTPVSVAGGWNTAEEPGPSCSVVRPAQTAGQRQVGQRRLNWKVVPRDLKKDLWSSMGWVGLHVWWGRNGPTSTLTLNWALMMSISCRAFSVVWLLHGTQVGEVCCLDGECRGVVTGDLCVVLLQWLWWLYPSWDGFCVSNPACAFSTCCVHLP